MNRLAYFVVSFYILFAFLSGVEAGPACARRNEGTEACIELCKGKWGWSGFVMGSDRWGQVLTKTVTKTDALGAAVTKACRVRPSGALSNASATTSATTTSVVPTVPPQNVAGTASVSTDVPTTSSAAPNSTSFAISLLSRTSTVSQTSSKQPTALANTRGPKPSTSTTTERAQEPEQTTTSTTPKPTTTTTHTTPRTTTSAPPPPPETTTVKPTPTSSTKAPEPKSTPSSGSGNSGTSSSSTSQSDIDAYLSAHNTIRAQHGANALTWSDDLAAAAQKWANNCVFKHSGGSLGPFGENLAAGTGSSYGIAAAVKSWTDEVSEYNSNNPQPSHFTQVVWKATTQVGCAVQSCNGIFDASFGPAKFFVCEYSPAGNVIGQFAENVQA